MRVHGLYHTFYKVVSCQTSKLLLKLRNYILNLQIYLYDLDNG